MRSAVTPNEEHRVRGSRIGLPLVETLGAIRSHRASRIAWHSHRMFELLFLLEGATAYEFADGQTVELPGGHFLVVPPSAVHRGLHELRMPATLCGVVFHPRRKQATQHTPFTPAELEWMARLFAKHARRPRPMSAELRRLAIALNRAVCAPASEDPTGHATLRLLVCAAILEASRQLTSAQRSEPKGAVEAAIAHMEQHFADPLPITELARAAHCGRARLFHVFKLSTGLTPNDYLQRLRMKKAADLLKQSGRTITEVAQETGYSSSQYFCHVFRRYTGTTPSAFRTEGNGGGDAKWPMADGKGKSPRRGSKV
jgi:AraC-like DNA-binding protein/mannose-6-phosphate isomerase-like protein (cupin superfamily)